MKLIHPQIVPIRILTVLARNNIHTTDEVHRCIREGNLIKLRGIGEKTKRNILRYYTEE